MADLREISLQDFDNFEHFHMSLEGEYKEFIGLCDLGVIHRSSMTQAVLTALSEMSLAQQRAFFKATRAISKTPNPPSESDDLIQMSINSALRAKAGASGAPPKYGITLPPLAYIARHGLNHEQHSRGSQETFADNRSIAHSHAQSAQQPGIPYRQMAPHRYPGDTGTQPQSSYSSQGQGQARPHPQQYADQRTQLRAQPSAQQSSRLPEPVKVRRVVEDEFDDFFDGPGASQVGEGQHYQHEADHRDEMGGRYGQEARFNDRYGQGQVQSGNPGAHQGRNYGEVPQVPPGFEPERRQGVPQVPPGFEDRQYRGPGDGGEYGQHLGRGRAQNARGPVGYNDGYDGQGEWGGGANFGGERYQLGGEQGYDVGSQYGGGGGYRGGEFNRRNDEYRGGYEQQGGGRVGGGDGPRFDGQVGYDGHMGPRGNMAQDGYSNMRGGYRGEDVRTGQYGGGQDEPYYGRGDGGNQHSSQRQNGSGNASHHNQYDRDVHGDNGRGYQGADGSYAQSQQQAPQWGNERPEQYPSDNVNRGNQGWHDEQSDRVRQPHGAASGDYNQPSYNAEYGLSSSHAGSEKGVNNSEHQKPLGRPGNAGPRSPGMTHNFALKAKPVEESWSEVKKRNSGRVVNTSQSEAGGFMQGLKTGLGGAGGGAKGGKKTAPKQVGGDKQADALKRQLLLATLKRSAEKENQKLFSDAAEQSNSTMGVDASVHMYLGKYKKVEHTIQAMYKSFTFQPADFEQDLLQELGSSKYTEQQVEQLVLALQKQGKRMQFDTRKKDLNSEKYRRDTIQKIVSSWKDSVADERY